MCLQHVPAASIPEILKARQKYLAKRHWELLDILKSIPKAIPKK